MFLMVINGNCDGALFLNAWIEQQVVLTEVMMRPLTFFIFSNSEMIEVKLCRNSRFKLLTGGFFNVTMATPIIVRTLIIVVKMISLIKVIMPDEVTYDAVIKVYSI